MTSSLSESLWNMNSKSQIVMPASETFFLKVRNTENMFGRRRIQKVFVCFLHSILSVIITISCLCVQSKGDYTCLFFTESQCCTRPNKYPQFLDGNVLISVLAREYASSLSDSRGRLKAGHYWRNKPATRNEKGIQLHHKKSRELK